MDSNQLLKGHELFRSLTIEEADSLSNFSTTRRFDTGQLIFNFNAPSTHVYMLMNGAVDLRLPGDPGGSELVVSKIAIGELFGLSTLLDSDHYTTAAQCTAPSEVLAIEAKPLRDLLHQNCPVALEVLNQVARIYFSRYLGLLSNLQSVVNQIHLVR